MLVAIDLTSHDDEQLIFETLNDRGTPLLKADLIKNWLDVHGNVPDDRLRATALGSRRPHRPSPNQPAHHPAGRHPDGLPEM